MTDDRRRDPKLVYGVAVGVTFGGLFLAACCLVGWLAWNKGGSGGSGGGAGPSALPSHSHVWSRDEFRAAAMGKTAAEVLATFGRPSHTFDHPDGSPNAWHYDDRVRNPATGRIESGILDFHHGRVSTVRW
jgi:hypothetical protein